MLHDFRKMQFFFSLLLIKIVNYFLDQLPIYSINIFAHKPRPTRRCGLSTWNYGNLNNHFCIYTQTKLFIYKECNTRFSDKLCLIRHTYIYVLKKPFTFEMWNKTQKLILISHFPIHPRETPFICELHKTKFAYKLNVQRCIYIHMLEWPLSNMRGF